MGIADFLFEGKPPPSTTQYGTKTETLPAWISDYTQGLIAKANAVAAEPYQQYGGPRVAGFTPDTMNAFAQTRAAAKSYESPLQQALGLTQQATDPANSGSGAAQSYMQAAGQNFPGAVQQYMDPYVGNVIDRSKDLANRNFFETLMPQISDRFTRAGQYGSSGMLDQSLKGARDVSENLQSAANSQLSQAYQNAGQMFNQDASRQGTLAQLAGSLAGQNQNALLQGGAQMGNLAAQSQQLGITGATALDTIGQMQQGQNQKNLDTAYQDFLSQTNYPRQTIDWMSSVIRGMPAPVSTSTTQTGPTTVGASPLAQIGGAAAGIGALADIFTQKP